MFFKKILKKSTKKLVSNNTYLYLCVVKSV